MVCLHSSNLLQFIFIPKIYFFFTNKTFLNLNTGIDVIRFFFYISKFVVGENIKNAEKNVKHFVDHVEDSLWDLIVVVFHSKLFVIYRLDACFLFISPYCQY